MAGWRTGLLDGLLVGSLGMACALLTGWHFGWVQKLLAHITAGA